MTEQQERWNERYRDPSRPEPGRDAPPNPPAALTRAEPYLPTAGFAVDLAGGDGGGAFRLARRGLDTTLVDVSDVALERAEAWAGAAGHALTTVRADLSVDPGSLLDELIPAPLGDTPEPGVVCCFHYLDRELLQAVPSRLRPGVVFVAAVATVRNLERHERPSARFLLEPGEVEALLTGGSDGAAAVEVLHHTEDWTPEGRHEAEIVITGAA